MNSTTITQSIKVALFFILGTALVWTVYETFSESHLYTEAGYKLRAGYQDLKQLKDGSDVRYSGVSIGSVVETKLEGGEAVAVLSIESKYKVPMDSIAIITTAGLLGGNYVAIQPGRAVEFLKDGDKMRTKETSDISTVLAEVGEIAKKFNQMTGGDSSGDFFGGLGKLVEENKPKIEHILTNLETVTGKLGKEEGTLGKLINSSEAYDSVLGAVKDFQKASKDASEFLGDAKVIVANINQGKGTLGVLLSDEKLAQEIRDAVKNIDEFTTKLNSDKSTLGRLISDDSLYVKADNALNKVNNAVQNMENSGPITAVGVAAQALF